MDPLPKSVSLLQPTQRCCSISVEEEHRVKPQKSTE